MSARRRSATLELEQAKGLERGLVAVRWLAVALGVYLVSQTNTGPPPYGGRAVVVGGQVIMAALAVANVLVVLLTDRARTIERVRRLGGAVFAVDALAAFALTWLFSYDPKGSVWVVIYILPLEGAVRYRLEGALGIVGVTLVNELAREMHLANRFPGSYEFLLANVVLRVGVQALVALVAGFMARSLAREAENAAEQARRFQEAARRESLARRELAAFNTAILTGVAAEDLDMSMQSMATAIGRDLEFETFAVLLREGDSLVLKGVYGMAEGPRRVPVGRGVTGTVAATGRPLLVRDVAQFPAYLAADPRMRSEMAAPLRIGDAVIGVIDVESRAIGAFDEAALGLLTRLADQIALVVHSAWLYASQKETLERLRELDQMKSDFVAIASHELRTPLTAIHGYVTTLARRLDGLSREDAARFLATISRQSERMARLVEDLLLVSRIEAGAIRIQTRRVDLRAFLDATLEALGPGERARVRVEAPAGPVELDPDRAHQVLQNLIGNALKFSPPESPVLVRASREDGHLWLRVEDRGIGIPPDEVPRVFERFHQAGSVTTRQAEGAGLGLYITKKLVEAMEGTIEAASTPGVGSTFTVRLPQPREDAEGTLPASAPDAVAGLEPGQGGEARRARQDAATASRSEPNVSTRAGS